MSFGYFFTQSIPEERCRFQTFYRVYTRRIHFGVSFWLMLQGQRDQFTEQRVWTGRIKLKAALLFVDSRLDPGRYRRIQFRELMQSSETIRTQRLRLLVYGVHVASFRSSSWDKCCFSAGRPSSFRSYLDVSLRLLFNPTCQLFALSNCLNVPFDTDSLDGDKKDGSVNVHQGLVNFDSPPMP